MIIKIKEMNWKSPIPVCRSTHFLLLVCAGGRVSVSIVVKAVEGVVSVIKHVYTLRSGTCDPKWLSWPKPSSNTLSCCSALPPCSAQPADTHSELCWWRLPPAPTLPLLVPAALSRNGCRSQDSGPALWALWTLVLVVCAAEVSISSTWTSDSQIQISCLLGHQHCTLF